MHQHVNIHCQKQSQTHSMTLPQGIMFAKGSSHSFLFRIFARWYPQVNTFALIFDGCSVTKLQNSKVRACQKQLHIMGLP